MKIECCYVSNGSPRSLLRSFFSNQQVHDYCSVVSAHLQEQDSHVEDILRSVNVHVTRYNNNLGLVKLFNVISDSLSEDYLLFLEDDWQLVPMRDAQVFQILSDSIYMLQNGVDIVKLRNRRCPGEPLHSKKCYNESTVKHFKYKLEAIHWLDNINLPGVEHIVHNGLDWYITTERHQVWSNNPFICKSKFFKEQVWPTLEKFYPIVNQKRWWDPEPVLIKHLQFKVGASDGLFTHNDS